ncbi:type II toxin-antitoxin system VapB family antitoxin [Chitinivorax sp. B]|uniref:type II toxin-antitoxin system VapB family antitoxin n=1 Tax=Chitinivorax sp. B TaxID=2502235 RepID=UPI0010F81582|nr:type II toxin-antitoxin system VapB family antitoxin [Chitinivorax sp. B]
MQITITIDDALYEQALELAGPAMDKADLIQAALKTFIHIQTAKRLAALGGTMPTMQAIKRRDEPSDAA